MYFIDVKDLDVKDASEPLSLDLHENLNHYEAKLPCDVIYDRRKSRHCVTVKRLLWADGLGHSIVNGEKSTTKQDMTLVILKIVLAPYIPEKEKFWHMRLSLIFEDMDQSGINQPQVLAWAPGTGTTGRNGAATHHEKSGEKERNVEVDNSVTSATVTWSSEGAVSWDQTSFEKKRSSPMLNPKTNNLNGVSWYVEQYDSGNVGDTQELFAAVLLSRPTAEPYLARFEINARVNTKEDVRNKTVSLFGLESFHTEPFKITPRANQVCCYEGKYIWKCIDINNLDKLRCERDIRTLDIKWGPKYQVEATALEGPSSSSATTDLLKNSQSETSPVSKETLAQTATPSDELTSPAAIVNSQPLPEMNLSPLVGQDSSDSVANTDSDWLIEL